MRIPSLSIASVLVAVGSAGIDGAWAQPPDKYTQPQVHIVNRPPVIHTPTVIHTPAVIHIPTVVHTPQVIHTPTVTHTLQNTRAQRTAQRSTPRIVQHSALSHSSSSSGQHDRSTAIAHANKGNSSGYNSSGRKGVAQSKLASHTTPKHGASPTTTKLATSTPTHAKVTTLSPTTSKSPPTASKLAATQQFATTGNPSHLINNGAAKGSANFMASKHGLPKFNAVAKHAGVSGKVLVPVGVRPRLTLLANPRRLRLGGDHLRPFVQREWRHKFFWVAIVGLGYLTIPADYYEDFIGYVDDDRPNYEAAARGLSAIALEDDEDEREHVVMPAGTVYRYEAPEAPPAPKGKLACRLNVFVERQWNRPFVWVKVPDVGNITVPEDSYDRFLKLVSQTPPAYSEACALLAEAATNDTYAESEPQ